MQPQPYLDARLADVYHRGNEMPDTSLRAWADLVASFSPVASPTALDVGTGTGMFAVALAQRCSASQVAAVDPSPAMLTQAAIGGSHPRVHYVCGSAAALPIGDRTIDLALLSRVIHHVPDRKCCGAELKRVLRPGGAAVVRTTLRENLGALVYDYWPGLREHDASRFTSLSELKADFAATGLRLVRSLSFAQPVRPSLRAYHDALVGRPQSKFAPLTESEFAAGLARMRRAAEQEACPAEVCERYDVLCFRRD